MDAPEVDRRIDELYDTPPEDFTAARNALAKQLRAEKQRDQAGRVSQLRRPTVAAWAVNQTVRKHPDRFAALLAAGADVRRTQRRALSGVRNSGLREVSRTRRELVDDLTDLAATILVEHGANAQTHRSDIAATFDAASTDDETAETVGAGRLAAPLPVSSGFGSIDALTVLEPEEPAPAGDGQDRVEAGETDPAAAAERERAALRRRDAMRAVQEMRRLLEQAEAAVRRATKDATKRADAAATAARSAEAAEDSARRKREEADRLAQRAQEAEDAVADAQQRVERSAAELYTREQQLSELQA